MKDVLNKILESSDISHNRFSQDIEVSKSYVLTMLKGTKPITENIYHRMLKLDYVAPYTEELTEAYMRHRMGNSSYELVKHYLAEAESFSKEPAVVPPEENLQFALNQQYVDHEELIPLVCNLLRKCIKKGQPFYTNYPFTFSELDEALYATAKEQGLYSSEVIFHTITHSRVLDKELISAYWRALRWGFMRVETEIAFSEYASHPIPFFAAGCDNVVLFGTEGGCLIRSAELAEKFALHPKEASKLVTVVQDETALLTNEPVLTNKKIRTMEYDVCPVGIYDHDMIAASVPDSLPPEIAEKLITALLYYYDVSGRCADFKSYSKIEAVLERLKTGCHYAISKKYLNEFSPEARRTQIERLLESSHHKFIRAGKINLPKAYAIDAFDKIVHTHFMFQDDDAADYEIYAEYRYTEITGLRNFIDNIFDYLDLEFNTYSDADGRSVLKQYAILGGEGPVQQ